MSTSWPSLWAAFGKFAAVVAVVSALVGIYVTLAPSGPRLLVKHSSYDFSLPPDVTDTFEALRKANSVDELTSITSSPLGYLKTEKLQDDRARELASRLVEHLNAAWPARFRFFTPDFGDVHYLTITNDGDRPAEDVTLDLPRFDVAVVTDGSARRPVRAGPLKLGVIRPRTSIGVTIWGSPSKWDWEPPLGRLNITYSQGVGEIIYGTEVFGWRGDLANSFWLAVMFAVAVGFCLVIAIVMSRGKFVLATVTRPPEPEPPPRTVVTAVPASEVPKMLSAIDLFERVNVMDAPTAAEWREALRAKAAEQSEPVAEA